MLTKGSGEENNDEDRSRTDEAPSDVSAAHRNLVTQRLLLHGSAWEPEATLRTVTGSSICNGRRGDDIIPTGVVRSDRAVKSSPGSEWDSHPGLKLTLPQDHVLLFNLPSPSKSCLSAFSTDVTHHMCLGLILMFCVALWSSAMMRHTLAKTQQPPFELTHRSWLLKGILQRKVNPWSNTPWHRVRPPLERSSFPTAILCHFSNFRNDHAITIHCSLCPNQETKPKIMLRTAPNFSNSTNRVPEHSSRHQTSASLARGEHNSPLCCNS